MWITCGLLWCFYQLFRVSFWRHPFTAEHPLVSKWCNATFLQICSEEETNSSTSWMTWAWVLFSNFVFIFVWTLPLRPGMCIRQIKTSSKYCGWGIVLKMTCMKKHTSSKCLADVCLLSAPSIWVTLISFMWFSSSNAESNWSRCFIYLFSWNHFLKHTAESLSISSASNFRNGLHTLVFAASWNSHTWLMKWTQTKWLYSESFNAKHISWISKINTK